MKLGDKVRDKVSGFEGIATARTEWLNGCLRWGISPRVGEDGKLPEDIWVDDQQIEVLEEDPQQFFPKEAHRMTGGPTSSVDRQPKGDSHRTVR